MSCVLRLAHTMDGGTVSEVPGALKVDLCAIVGIASPIVNIATCVCRRCVRSAVYIVCICYSQLNVCILNVSANLSFLLLHDFVMIASMFAVRTVEMLIIQLLKMP